MHLELYSNSLTLVSRPHLIWPQPPSISPPLSHSISWVTWASLQLLNYTQFLSASQCPCICSSAWNLLPPHHITSFSFSSFRAQLRSWQLSEALPDHLHLPLCFALPCFTSFVSVILLKLVCYLYAHLSFFLCSPNAGITQVGLWLVCHYSLNS